MLSLLKKTGDQKKDELRFTAWHADFRELKALPDTKAVRTTFLYNSLAIGIPLMLGLYLVIKEVNLASQRSEIAGFEENIAAKKDRSEKALAQQAQFAAEEKKLQEVTGLASGTFDLAAFLDHFGTVLPYGIKITRVDYTGSNRSVRLVAYVQGSDAAATETASAFAKKLQQDPVLSAQFSAVTQGNISRNTTENTLGFELTFVAKAPSPAKK
jgi:Tfp pilus assembly protein PilN